MGVYAIKITHTVRKVSRVQCMQNFLFFFCLGQLVLAIISVLPWTKERFRSSYENYADVLKCKGLFPIVVGTFLLGSGMTLSGAVSTIIESV